MCNIELKTTDLGSYYAYVAHCACSPSPPLDSSLAMHAGSVTLSHYIFVLWHNTKHRVVSWQLLVE